MSSSLSSLPFRSFNFDKMLSCSSEVVATSKSLSCSPGVIELISYQLDVIKRNSLCFKPTSVSEIIDSSLENSSDVVSWRDLTISWLDFWLRLEQKIFSKEKFRNKNSFSVRKIFLKRANFPFSPLEQGPMRWWCQELLLVENFEAVEIVRAESIPRGKFSSPIFDFSIWLHFWIKQVGAPGTFLLFVYSKILEREEKRILVEGLEGGRAFHSWHFSSLSAFRLSALFLKWIRMKSENFLHCPAQNLNAI